ncbi:MAG TPA: AAA family ATPase [bacterium]|nr:AAA family ATPase [bacterium]
MKKKKISYGLQNFETLIMDNNYYVDKTKYIELLENLDARYPGFLKPHKFGKSLCGVMMNYYYAIRHKYKFKKLFSDCVLE